MPNEKSSKKRLPTNGEQEPKTAPEVPDEMKLKIVDSTADSVPEPEEIKKAATEIPESPEAVDDNETDDAEEPSLEDDSEDSTDEDANDEESTPEGGEPPKPAGKFKRFFAGFWHHKKWTLPLLLLVVIGALLAVPATRYKLLGLYLTKPYKVEVMDSKTNTPVSGASVKLDNQTATTDSEGRASFTPKVGKHSLQISKKYYKDFSEEVFVGLGAQKKAASVELDATGRQVPIKVVNKITGKAIRDAEVKVLDTEAKTDVDGMATIVLPTTSPTQPVKIFASGYNAAAGKIQVTDKVVAANTFPVTPNGRIYFLSNQSGNIDVVSSNLDGTARKTVLAGTGREDSNTALLTSHDWKYLALLSKRDGNQKLYLIDATTGDTTVVEAGSDLGYTLIGWIGHHFVYSINKIDAPSQQPNARAVKSFDADTFKHTTLAQSAAQGNQYDYAYQFFGNFSIVGDKLLFTSQWNMSFVGYAKNKKDQIIGVGADGSNRQVLKEIPYPDSGDYLSISTTQYKPQGMYVRVSVGANSTFYEYKNGYLTQSNTVNNDVMERNYPIYFVAPSGNQTLRSEVRDGKAVVLLGDANGSSEQQTASLDNAYQAYGWFTDNYVLVSKNSQLYIMSASGGKPLLISGYDGGRVQSAYGGGNYYGF